MMTPDERFFGRVKKNAPNGCWLWKGPVNSRGYGLLGYGGRNKTILVHRYSYQRTREIPDGQQVLHKCGEKLCVNPKHLFAGDALASANNRRRLGTQPSGEQNGHARMTEDKVDEIRRLFAAGQHRVKAIARLFRFTESGVREIVNGVTWKITYGKYKDELEAVRKKLYHRLGPKEIDEIRRLYAAGGITQKGLAAQFEVSSNTVWQIVRKRRADVRP